MAINKKLIHFKTKQNFENEVANGNILDTSIVFIQDSNEIYTHGTYYSSVNWSVLEVLNPYQFVDLDLPSGTQWATCNLGASNPWEIGTYFLWGNVEDDIETFSVHNDKYFSSNSFSKYNESDGKITLDASDDAATFIHESMRTPSPADCQELIDNTTITYESLNGKYGRKFTSKKDSSKYIFLPISGTMKASGWSDTTIGWYMTTTLEDVETDWFYALAFDSTGISSTGTVARGVGTVIRAIK